MRFSVTAFCLVCISLMVFAVHAEIPQMISYQGKVTDTGGTPIADGDYSVTFTVYDAVTSGNALWNSGSLTVTVSDGIFSALLGDTGQPTLNLDFDVDYWLEVDIAGDVQAPRTRLGSVGYAYMASGLIPGTEVSGEVSTGTLSVIKGVNTSTTGISYGIYVESASTDGRGVYGEASATTGYTYGVYGYSKSTNGRGVIGSTMATTGQTYGVFGYAPSDGGTGVWGYAYASTGTTYGIHGESNSADGTGVYGEATATTGLTYGVYGESASTDGRGVYGGTTATTGYAYGVYGESASTSGMAVYGEASASTGNTYGVYGRTVSTDGRGVYGVGPRFGVYGEATSTTSAYGGVFKAFGTSYGASGVRAIAEGTTGETYGVDGISFSPSGRGVRGTAAATTGAPYAVWGWRHPDNSGYGVWYSGGLGGTGSKSCVVKTSQGPTLLYCQESPGCWFEDFGEGQLVNGSAHVELDPLFLETVTIDEDNPMKVFVQLRDDCKGMYVKTGTRGFDIIELQGGTSSAAFAYRVVAKRKGFEEKRLDYCKAAERDPYLYPELQEELLRELEEERARMEEERRLRNDERERMNTKAAEAASALSEPVAE